MLCTRRPETFEAAKAERLKVSGNPSQYDDLDLFLREQESIRRLAQQSILPVYEVDISDDNVEGAADRIADWLEQTGGLSMSS